MKFTTYVRRAWRAAIAFLRKPETMKTLASVGKYALMFFGGCVVSYEIFLGKLDVETAKVILTWLVKTSGIDWPAVIFTTVLPVLLSARKNHHEERRVEKALEMPAGSTPDDLTAEMKRKA